MFALADDQLHRVADAAVQARYQQLGGEGEPPLFDRLTWLHEHGELSNEQLERWHAVRKLRNYGSHPSFQTLVMPSDVRATLGLMAGFITAVFPDTAG